MSSSIINPTYKNRVCLGIAATCFAAGAMFAPWEEVKIVGLTVLTSVIYKVASNMIACRKCIDFFTADRRLVKTLDPNLNAVIYATDTAPVSAIIGSMLAFIARVSFDSFKCKVTSAQLLPYFAIGAVVTLVLSHLHSLIAARTMEQLLWDKSVGFKTLESDFYKGVPEHLQGIWTACAVRNATSLKLFALGGVALVGAILAARLGRINLSRPFNF